MTHNTQQQPIDALKEIRMMLRTGAISFEEAKKKAAPLFEAINERGKQIAKEHGIKRYKPISFTSFMR